MGAFRYRVGATSNALDGLGGVGFVDLPDEGQTLAVGRPFAFIEGPSGQLTLATPVSGEVLKRNDELFNTPGTLEKVTDGVLCTPGSEPVAGFYEAITLFRKPSHLKLVYDMTTIIFVRHDEILCRENQLATCSANVLRWLRKHFLQVGSSSSSRCASPVSTMTSGKILPK